MIGVGEEAGGEGAGMGKSWKLRLRGVSIQLEQVFLGYVA